MASVERKKFFFSSRMQSNSPSLNDDRRARWKPPAVSPLKISTISDRRSNRSPSASISSGTACIVRNSLTPSMI